MPTSFKNCCSLKQIKRKICLEVDDKVSKELQMTLLAHSNQHSELVLIVDLFLTVLFARGALEQKNNDMVIFQMCAWSTLFSLTWNCIKYSRFK